MRKPWRDDTEESAVPTAVAAFDSIVETCRWFLVTHGWTCIFSLVAIYLAWPYLKIVRAKWSLAQAKDPRRVSILNEDRVRIREQQQREYNVKIKAQQQTDQPTSKNSFPSSSFQQPRST